LSRALVLDEQEMIKNQEKIEKICKGKNIRIFSVRDETASVSFVESYRNCGKKSCNRCKNRSKRPHGPYWNLNYVDEKGKVQTSYVGKKLPDIAFKHGKLLFSDVIRFYQDSESSKESIARYQAETLRLKKEVERLFEELRSVRRSARIKPANKADKIYKNLVMKYHPDRNSGKLFVAEEVMKDLNQLYRQMLER
jgi:Family of unknown function (DUF6788)